MGGRAGEAACEKAADAEAFNVGLIGRMLERATEGNDIEPHPTSCPCPVVCPSRRAVRRQDAGPNYHRRPRSGLRSQRRGRFPSR